MKIEKTFTATIYVGRKVRYDGRVHRLDAIRKALSAYVNEVGLCVTLTETEFIYSNGGEMGVAVGLINYPRFPSEPVKVRAHALKIAEMLMKVCEQMKVTIVFPDATWTIGETN
jgi:hypothetical protein